MAHAKTKLKKTAKKFWRSLQKILKNAILLFFIFHLTASCVTGYTSLLSSSYDSRKITLQTFNLFNQRKDPLGSQSKQNWKGDWIFRRYRLEALDQELRLIKPDLIFFQEAMKRIDYSIESDEIILKAGSLLGYEWLSKKNQSYADTEEAEYAAVAFGFPLKITPHKFMMDIYQDGYIASFIVQHEEQEIALLNVKEPSSVDLGWFDLITIYLQKNIHDYKICPKRIILAGHLPTKNYDKHFNQVLKNFRLKDLSEGLCEQESNCYTKIPQNQLLKMIQGDVTGSREEKIFVHEEAMIDNSSRNFTRSYPFSEKNKNRYLLSQLWISPYAGWTGSVRLGRCSSLE